MEGALPLTSRDHGVVDRGDERVLVGIRAVHYCAVDKGLGRDGEPGKVKFGDFEGCHSLQLVLEIENSV